MKKTVLACILVILICAAVAAGALVLTASPSGSGAVTSPLTADLNVLIVVPIMLIAAFIIFVILRHRLFKS